MLWLEWTIFLDKSRHSTPVFKLDIIVHVHGELANFRSLERRKTKTTISLFFSGIKKKQRKQRQLSNLLSQKQVLTSLN